MATQTLHNTKSRSSIELQVQDQNGDAHIHSGLPAPTTAVSPVQTWNRPRSNIWKISATFMGFIVMGANDAAYGALIPYLETYYHLNYTIISLIFLSPLVGYTSSALLNNFVHMKVGQRGIALIGPGAHLIAYIVIALHPPYPVLVVVFILAGFGNGLEDAAWNAWIGVMASANQILGFLHGFYGLGATLSPLIATTMITKANLEWYTFYYIMIGGAAIELVASLWAFWPETGAKFRAANPRLTEKKGGRTKEALSNRVTWICSLFLLAYVGVEVALGGWIVTFMIQVRRGTPFASGISATGFWLGITAGRVILGFVTPRLGEKLAIVIYLAFTVALELIFWLLPNFVVSAVAVALLGFFLGPMFPAAVIAATKLLPKHLHVSAIGFAAAFGSGGACVLPFVVGAVAQAKGVQVLQPIVLAILVVCAGLWVLLPRLPREHVN